MFFASDNNSPVPPQVFEAIARANEGYAPAYGNDPLTEQVAARIREVFEAPEAAVYLVATGTAANALALACYCPPWGAVYCHRASHIEQDECGAPEFFTSGAKLVLLDGEHGRITPDTLEAKLAAAQHVGVHNVQRGILSLTNTTEAGTVYGLRDVAALTAIARRYGVPSHMDGARFANALVAAGCTPAELTWKAGIDVLSFGGTKNGLMGVEAVVIFDPARAWEFELRRKRGGHLFSKHRYLAGQMAAYLEGDLWLSLADKANAAAARLAQSLQSVPGLRLEHPVEANMLFPSFPRAAHRRAREAGASYYFTTSNATLDGPGDEELGARLVCSWCTTDGDIDRFVDLLKG